MINIHNFNLLRIIQGLRFRPLNDEELVQARVTLAVFGIALAHSYSQSATWEEFQKKVVEGFCTFAAGTVAAVVFGCFRGRRHNNGRQP